MGCPPFESISQTPTASDDVLDRYLLAKTHDFVVDVEAQMDEYDVAGACQSVREHLDVLTNWYVRRSRARFWDGASEGSHAAFDTLYTVLVTVSQVVPE